MKNPPVPALIACFIGLTAFFASIPQFEAQAAVPSGWQSVVENLDVSVSSPRRSRRSPDATVLVDIANNGTQVLTNPLRLLITDLQPGSVSLAGAQAAAEGLVIDLSAAAGDDGLVPGETLPRLSLVFAGGGTTTFTFDYDVQQQVAVVPDMPTVHITSPESLATLGATPITVTGTVSPPEAMLALNGIPVDHNGGTFTAQVALQEGHNTVVARAVHADQQVTDAISVSLDMTPPYITLESHEDGETVYTDTVTITGLINDLVRGTVEAEKAAVTVNGITARIANRSYAAQGVMLQEGPNTITVHAVDQVGNANSMQFRLRYVVPTERFVEAISGQGQTAVIGAVLPEPLRVRVVDGDEPVVGVPVVFRVMQGAGQVGAGTPTMGRAVVVETDAAGTASTAFQVGVRVGVANHKVKAAVVGYESEVIFNASASGQIGNKISVNSGNNQRGAADQVLPAPLVVVVTDGGANVVEGARVRFEITRGEGHFTEGGTVVERVTDGDGRANAEWVLGELEGLDAQRVTVTLLDKPEGQTITSGFTATAFVPGDPGLTTISGVVLDNQDIPVPGVTVRVDSTTRQAVADEQGRFLIEQAPVGPVHLVADGSTAQVEGEFPSLSYSLVTVAGVDNPLPAPIYMIKLDTENAVWAGPEDAVLTLAGYPGFKLEIAKDSVTFPDGSREGYISVTPVNVAKIPTTPPNGMQPKFIVTIQPTGTRFDPPARLTIPNVDVHRPGAQVEMYSFDHDLEEFVAIGLGTVSEDGSVIHSNPGVGVVEAGWHCGSQPTGQGCAHNCPVCQTCDGDCNCVPSQSDARTASMDQPGDCQRPECADGGVTQVIDDSDVPEDAAECSTCENGVLNASDDGAGCDDGKFCTSAGGLAPGADECTGGRCTGKAIERQETIGGSQSYDFTKLRQILNGATLAQKFVPGCESRGSPVIQGAFAVKGAKECCESRQEIVDAVGFEGKVGVEVPAVKCRVPAFTWGVATLTGNISVAGVGELTASGWQSPCEENCSWQVQGAIGVEVSGGIGVNVISPDIIEIEGGIKGAGKISLTDSCGDWSASGCVGPPTAYGKVTLGGWIGKEISYTFRDLVACYP